MANQSTVSSTERIRVWDLPLRLFHWVLVIAIALAFLSSEEDSALNNWHVLSGWVAATLLVFRIAWGFLGGEHSRFSDFLKFGGIGRHVGGLFRGKVEPTLGHNQLGSIAVVLILLLVGGTVWTGAFMGEAGEELHEIIAWTLLGLVAVHIAAVIVTSLLSRENLVRAMVDGTKAAARHPDASDARRPGLLAILLSVLLVGGTIYGIKLYDPEAFTLRSVESFELRSGEGGTAEVKETEQEKD